METGMDGKPQDLLPSREPTSALMPITATQPTTITVMATRTSLATPTMEGLMVSVWMWLMAPEWVAAREKDSMVFFLLPVKLVVE